MAGRQAGRQIDRWRRRWRCIYFHSTWVSPIACDLWLRLWLWVRVRVWEGNDAACHPTATNPVIRRFCCRQLPLKLLQRLTTFSLGMLPLVSLSLLLLADSIIACLFGAVMRERVLYVCGTCCCSLLLLLLLLGSSAQQLIARSSYSIDSHERAPSSPHLLFVFLFRFCFTWSVCVLVCMCSVWEFEFCFVLIWKTLRLFFVFCFSVNFVQTDERRWKTFTTFFYLFLLFFCFFF